MKHLDLFSGIGGFAYAMDQVFQADHIFCDNDPFCQEVLKKNYPNSKIYGDIKEITNESADIVTGGFPCQPFSQAGKRRGTDDNRYLWPEMFRVIQLAKPSWVIAENVGGLLTWNEGMVLEQVCTDLESENYEVQPLIIPACSVNAPHRRERVWIIAHSLNSRQGGAQSEVTRSSDSIPQKHRSKHSAAGELERTNSDRENDKHATNTEHKRQAQRQHEGRTRHEETVLEGLSRPDWNRDWQEVAFATCYDGVDDGLPKRLDRNPRLKALGNAIVPQVAEEIMRGLFK